jgi:hypothetical protein
MWSNLKFSKFHNRSKGRCLCGLNVSWSKWVSNVGCEVYEIVYVSLCYLMWLRVNAATLGCICWGFQFAYCNYGFEFKLYGLVKLNVACVYLVKMLFDKMFLESKNILVLDVIVSNEFNVTSTIWISLNVWLLNVFDGVSNLQIATMVLNWRIINLVKLNIICHMFNTKLLK